MNISKRAWHYKAREHFIDYPDQSVSACVYWIQAIIGALAIIFTIALVFGFSYIVGSGLYSIYEYFVYSEPLTSAGKALTILGITIAVFLLIVLAVKIIEGEIDYNKRWIVQKMGCYKRIDFTE